MVNANVHILEHQDQKEPIPAAGATYILNDRVSAYLYYDGEFARTHYQSDKCLERR